MIRDEINDMEKSILETLQVHGCRVDEVDGVEVKSCGVSAAGVTCQVRSDNTGLCFCCNEDAAPEKEAPPAEEE